MTAKVLLNPYAARWEAKKRWEQAAAALRSAGLAFEWVETSSVEDLREQARLAALADDAPIVIAGGDGTIGQAINGLAAAWGDDPTRWRPVGILPLGTANDFAANAGLPTDLDAAAAVIAAGKTRPVDLIRLNGRYFVNNAGIGMEATISWRQSRMTWAKGLWRYLAAALAEFFLYPQWPGRVQWEDGAWEGTITMLSLGNGRRTGGIYFTVPAADPFDGRLTFVIVQGAPRFRLLRLLRQSMDPVRSYLGEPEIVQQHARRLEVWLETPSPAHADGEIFTTAETHFVAEVLPGLLPLLAPESR